MRRGLVTLGVAFAGWWLVSFAAALAITRPRHVTIDARDRIGAARVEEVSTTTSDGLRVCGWLASPNDAVRRCVVLAAGIGAPRTALLSRAEWYLENGWAALLVDLRGTGASGGDRVSMGWHEALDLAAWHDFVRDRGHTTVVAHGQSLGAAAIVFSAVRATPAPRWDRVVLEACYRDIEAAMEARVPFVPALALRPLASCCEWLTGASCVDLQPVRAIRSLDAPTLFVCGTCDTKVGPDAAAALLAASPAREKRRHDVEGAAHVDLWPAGGDGLRRALAEFLAAR